MPTPKSKSKKKPARSPLIPDRAVKLDHARLAEGEVTGHFHEATGADVSLYQLGHDLVYLDAPSGSLVTHQEHAPIQLPPGTYSRRIVQEYDHLAEEARSVVD